MTREQIETEIEELRLRRCQGDPSVVVRLDELLRQVNTMSFTVEHPTRSDHGKFHATGRNR